MASQVSHLAAPRNGIVPENSLPTLASRPAGQGRASGPGETSEAARPAEPLPRRTSMRDRSLSLQLHGVCIDLCSSSWVKMSSSGPRVGVGQTRTVIAKKEAALRRPLKVQGGNAQGRAYTGVNPHRNKVMLRCNNCKQVSAVSRPLEIRNYAGFGRRWLRRHEPSAAVPSMLCSPYGRPSAHLLLVAPLPLKERPVVHAFHQTRRRRTSGPSALRCVIIRPVWRRPSPGDPPCPPQRPAPLS